MILIKTIHVVSVAHEFHDLSCYVISRIEFIARKSLLPLFDARDVTVPEHFRLCNKMYPDSPENHCKIAFFLLCYLLSYTCYENPRLRIETKPKLRKARVILRDISKLMSEKNFE